MRWQGAAFQASILSRCSVVDPHNSAGIGSRSRAPWGSRWAGAVECLQRGRSRKLATVRFRLDVSWLTRIKSDLAVLGTGR